MRASVETIWILSATFFKLPRPLGRGIDICGAALAKNGKGNIPTGFSQKAKAERKLFLELGSKPGSPLPNHDLKVVAI